MEGRRKKPLLGSVRARRMTECSVEAITHTLAMIVVVVVEELSMTFTLIVLDIGRKASNHQSLSSQQSGKITQLKHSGDKQQHVGL